MCDQGFTFYNYASKLFVSFKYRPVSTVNSAAGAKTTKYTEHQRAKRKVRFANDLKQSMAGEYFKANEYSSMFSFHLQ